MVTRMTPHGEQEIDDFYEAPEAPTPCVNCGSPACEWPGRCEESRCATCDHFEDEHDPECDACAGNVPCGETAPCLAFARKAKVAL